MADHQPPSPPATRREDIVDVYHGVPVADPYRWLESGDSPEVIEWVAAQNQHTRQALDARPHRERWHERLSALVALPTVLACAVRADRCFVLERDHVAEQFALVLRSSVDPAAPPRVLLAPATLVSDGAMAIDWFEPSPDGALVAIGLSEGGTEDSVLHVLDVGTASLSELRITDTRASSVAWLPDSTGFWYARYPAGDQYHRHIRFHLLGTDPAGDPVVFDRLPTPESWPEVKVSPDGAHLLVEVQVGWSRVDAHLLQVRTETWATIVEGVEAQSSFHFGADGLVGLTTLDAPNGRVVAVAFDQPTSEAWITVVPERHDAVLGRPATCGSDVLVPVSRSAVDCVEIWSVGRGLIDTLDAFGAVTVQQIDADDSAGLAMLVVSSFDSPTCVWRYDGRSVERWCPDAPSESDLSPLTVRHLCYPSLDGTEIGLFVIHRADVEPSAERPIILNGYGGFSITESPAWVPNIAAWCTAGGVWAIAGLRGGLEHGEPWHHAGRRANKQNVFDDFHSAADWLVAQGMASAAHLGLVGGSNGGLLVGAALTQRPDLARAVWCAVPLLDMVRFPLFHIARLWTDEYGDPDVPEEFGWLLAYSPYHSVDPLPDHPADPSTSYPAVLFTTAEGDTRVDPLHARKMAALLQHASANQRERPVLLLQAGRAGHGVGKPASMRVAEGVDVLSFLSWQLGSDSM